MKKLLYLLFSIGTSMIGYHIHGSLFWAIMDFIFTGLAWLKWLIFHQVNMRIIKETFVFFFQ